SLAQRLAQKKVPVILLSGRGDLETRISGLNAGALQYFVKPADLSELVAGIRSQLRRGADMAVAEVSDIVPWRLDLIGARLLAPNLREVNLTTRELELLSQLFAAQGGLVSKEALVEAMQAGSVADGFHRIESQLNRLRRKTAEATGLP